MGFREMMKAIGRLAETGGGPARGDLDTARRLREAENGYSARDDDEDAWSSDTSDVLDENGDGPANSGKRVSGGKP